MRESYLGDRERDACREREGSRLVPRRDVFSALLSLMPVSAARLISMIPVPQPLTFMKPMRRRGCVSPIGLPFVSADYLGRPYPNCV